MIYVKEIEALQISLSYKHDKSKFLRRKVYENGLQAKRKDHLIDGIYSKLKNLTSTFYSPSKTQK